MEPRHSQNAMAGNLAFMKPKHCYLIFTLDTTIDIKIQHECNFTFSPLGVFAKLIGRWTFLFSSYWALGQLL